MIKVLLAVFSFVSLHELKLVHINEAEWHTVSVQLETLTYRQRFEVKLPCGPSGGLADVFVENISPRKDRGNVHGSTPVWKIGPVFEFFRQRPHVKRFRLACAQIWNGHAKFVFVTPQAAKSPKFCFGVAPTAYVYQQTYLHFSTGALSSVPYRHLKRRGLVFEQEADPHNIYISPDLSFANTSGFSGHALGSNQGSSRNHEGSQKQASRDYCEDHHNPLCKRITRRNQPAVPMPKGTGLKIAGFLVLSLCAAWAFTYSIARLAVWWVEQKQN